MKAFGIVWIALFITYIPVAIRWDEKLRIRRMWKKINRIVSSLEPLFIELGMAAVKAEKRFIQLEKSMKEFEEINS